jgi:hypothetical protein
LFDSGSPKRMRTRTTLYDTTPADARKGQESGGQEQTRKYAPRIDDKSLSKSGALSVRLNRRLTHFPIPITGRSRCGIHRWCCFEKFHSVVECEDCHARLCMDCYKLFHTTPDLPSEKESLRQSFTHEWSLKSDTSKKTKGSSTR